MNILTLYHICYVILAMYMLDSDQEPSYMYIRGGSATQQSTDKSREPAIVRDIDGRTNGQTKGQTDGTLRTRSVVPGWSGETLMLLLSGMYSALLTPRHSFKNTKKKHISAF